MLGRRFSTYEIYSSVSGSLLPVVLLPMMDSILHATWDVLCAIRAFPFFPRLKLDSVPPVFEGQVLSHGSPQLEVLPLLSSGPFLREYFFGGS